MNKYIFDIDYYRLNNNCKKIININNIKSNVFYQHIDNENFIETYYYYLINDNNNKISFNINNIRHEEINNFFKQEVLPSDTNINNKSNSFDHLNINNFNVNYDINIDKNICIFKLNNVILNINHINHFNDFIKDNINYNLQNIDKINDILLLPEFLTIIDENNNKIKNKDINFIEELLNTYNNYDFQINIIVIHSKNYKLTNIEPETKSQLKPHTKLGLLLTKIKINDNDKNDEDENNKNGIYKLKITKNKINLYCNDELLYPKCLMYFDGGLSEDDELNDEYDTIKKIQDNKNKKYIIIRNFDEYYDLLYSKIIIKNINKLYVFYDCEIKDSEFIFNINNYRIEFENIKHILCYNKDNKLIYEINN